MPKGWKGVNTSAVKIELSQQQAQYQEDPLDFIDPVALAVVLSADYPLIDPPLIIAILSDHDPATIANHLEEIRDQLGILEATLVPETTDLTSEPADSAEDDVSLNSDHIHSGIQALAAINIQGTVAPVHAGNAGATFKAKTNSSASRTTSTSISRSSGQSTSPTTALDEDAVFADELELLKGLFSGISVEVVQNALSSEPGLQAAIDHLLSVELIRDVERRGFWPGEEDSHTDEEGWREAGPSTVARKAVGLDEVGITPPSSPRSSSRTRHSRKQTETTVPLVDTLQRKAVSHPPSRPSSRPSSRTQSPVGRRPVNGISSCPSPNAWHTIASLAGYLSELLPNHPPGYFLGYLHAPLYRSAYSAIRASLAALPSKETGDENVTSMSVLEDIYGLTLLENNSLRPGETDEVQADLKICVSAAGYEVASVMDLMDLLAEISLWPGDDDLERYDQRQAARTTPVSSPILPPASTAILHPVCHSTDRLTKRPESAIAEPHEKVIPGSKPAPSSALNPTAYDDFGLPSSPRISASTKHGGSKRQVHPLNWRTVEHDRVRPARGSMHPYASHIPAYSRGQLPNNPTPGSLFGTNAAGGVLTVAQCLRHAQAERLTRADAVRAAGIHFRGSSLSGSKAISGAVAGHYALQAREAADKARDWELKAARMVVDNQLQQTGHTIDLHHLTIQEASVISLEAVERWYERQKVLQFAGRAEANTAKTTNFVPREGMTIVTGVGRHSAGQRGVLGPAVANALEGHGWRVDRGDGGRGYLVVRGKR